MPGNPARPGGKPGVPGGAIPGGSPGIPGIPGIPPLAACCFNEKKFYEYHDNKCNKLELKIKISDVYIRTNCKLCVSNL